MYVLEMVSLLLSAIGAKFCLFWDLTLASSAKTESELHIGHTSPYNEIAPICSTIPRPPAGFSLLIQFSPNLFRKSSRKYDVTGDNLVESLSISPLFQVFCYEKGADIG